MNGWADVLTYCKLFFSSYGRTVQCISLLVYIRRPARQNQRMSWRVGYAIYYSLLHSFPSPVNPASHSQVYDLSSISVHVAFIWQGSCSHGNSSVTKKTSSLKRYNLSDPSAYSRYVSQGINTWAIERKWHQNWKCKIYRLLDLNIRNSLTSAEFAISCVAKGAVAPVKFVVNIGALCHRVTRLQVAREDLCIKIRLEIDVTM